MKKQYIAPALEVVKLNATDLIATSDPGLGSGFSDTGQGSLSRGDSGDWDMFDGGDWTLFDE